MISDERRNQSERNYGLFTGFFFNYFFNVDNIEFVNNISSILYFGLLATGYVGCYLINQEYNQSVPFALEGEVLTTGSPRKCHFVGFFKSE